MFDPIELAYMAGYFDGEGSVSVTHVARKYESVSAQLATSDEVVVRRFAEMFDVPIYKELPRSYTKRQMFRAKATGRQAQTILKTLLPYLRAKKAVAELALQVPICTPGGKLTEPEKKVRQELTAQIRAHNQRVTVIRPN